MAPNDRLHEIFLESASEVLETMCFVGVLGENTEPEVSDLISAELVFNGVPSGHFGVQVPSSTGRLIASNFLGKEAEDITEAEVEQVVGELANMICGSVLSRVEAGARFELLHPVIVPAGEGTPHPAAVQYTLELEEGVMILWMAIGDTVPIHSAA
jgi:CheY-specific phosphatase CheX